MELEYQSIINVDQKSYMKGGCYPMIGHSVLLYTITQQYTSVRQDCQTFVATANDGL